jgi:hypothetical protein
MVERVECVPLAAGDVVGGVVPDEGLWLGVVLQQSVVDRVLEVVDAGIAAAANSLCGGLGKERACPVQGADRSSLRYRHRRPDHPEVRDELHKTSGKHRRFCYRRLHVILCRDGHVLNRKRTQRL